MKIIVTASYEESSRAVADMICDLVRQKPNAKLGLATGSTPVPVYRAMIEKNKAGEVDFSAARAVNLDEYRGLAPDHPQSYRFFMDDNLFNHINIDKANTFVASGLGDAEAAAAELDAKVLEGGVTDLQLLGIGNNGHVGFNEAADHLVAASHVEQLTPSTIDANARFFEKREDVPTQAITMGMKSILAAKSIVLIATGAGKADAIRGLLADGKVTPQNPSTFIKLHDDVTVVIDQELASLAGYR